MQYKKVFYIILGILILFGGISSFDKYNKVINREIIDKVNLENVDKLMIVAHPDDETIWGGKHLLEDDYFILCLTNGDNQTRKDEFMKIIQQTNNKGLILDYPDKTNGKRDNWSKVKDDIKRDIQYILEKKNWKLIVTHNPDGEYGHIHHQMTSKIVTNQNYIDKNKLMYFGKYYKKKNKPDDLEKIETNDLEKKLELTKIYSSQKKVMEHLEHMMIHENWVKAEDWR